MADPLAVSRLGAGPPVVLVHGGAPPEWTWAPQEPLAERWGLAIPTRRGFPPNPPVERQDFELDAADLLALLEPSAHLVGFSYGGLGAVIAAAERPDLVRSLTVIESPFYALARDDPEVSRLEELSTVFLAEGLDAPREVLAEFFALAALPDPAAGPLPPDLERVARLALGGRPPGEAEPALDAIAAAGVPALVVSGGHATGIERICDALARLLQAERAVLAGHGHAVMRSPDFNPTLERHLSRAERRLS